MNVLVIGAAGKTGRLVVERGAAAGHRITAFVRDMNAYQPPKGNVRVVGGEATDPTNIADAMAGQEAVIDTIGGKTPYRDTDLERTVVRVLLAGMKQQGVPRLIAVSALGVADSRAQSGFLYKHLFLPTFLRGSTKDKAAMEQEILQGSVDFILVRPAILNDQPATGLIRIFEANHVAHKITRADVAQFLVDQLNSDIYLGKTVTIGNS